MATTPLAIRALDFATKSVPKFVVNHPVLTAAGVGVALGANAMRKPAYRVEDTLRAEQLGIPGSKYAPEELGKFSSVKEYLEVKCAYEKCAQDPPSPPPLRPLGDYVRQDLAQGFGSGVGKGIAEVGLKGVFNTLGRGAQSIHEKLFRDPKRKKILQEAIQNDPMLGGFEANNPGVIQRHFETLKRFAPTLSTDPNVVTSYLRATAPLGGSMDPTVIKGLAEAENAVQRAKNEGKWTPFGR